MRKSKMVKRLFMIMACGAIMSIGGSESALAAEVVQPMTSIAAMETLI